MISGSTKCESRRSTSCGQVLSPAAAVAPASTARRRSSSGSRTARASMPVRSRIACISGMRGQGGARSTSTPSRSIARRAVRRDRGGRDQRLGARHRVVDVGVGLVPLEQRELGVVLERHALVAEVLADLVDALEPADDQALEVELGRDAQVEVAVELVVVRRERPRVGAAVERLQRRRLDLDEAGAVELAAQGRDRARAQLELGAHLGVDQQVEVALAVARLDIGEPVVLVGQRAARSRASSS